LSMGVRMEVCVFVVVCVSRSERITVAFMLYTGHGGSLSTLMIARRCYLTGHICLCLCFFDDGTLLDSFGDLPLTRVNRELWSPRCASQRVAHASPKKVGKTWQQHQDR